MSTSELNPDPDQESPSDRVQSANVVGGASSADSTRVLNVLLVEDNPDDALLIQRHLRRNGFDIKVTRIETAPEMREALAASTTSESAQIVLADYNLPSFSGPEALRILKSSGIDLPFIMLSGAVSEEAAVESMRAGAQDYVTKQNLTRLVPAIERELKEAAARRNRVAAELALRASEDRFHRLVEAMPLGLLIGEASGRIIYANSAIERMLGYTAAVVAVGNFAAAGAVTMDSICPALQHFVSATLNDLTINSTIADAASVPPFESICIAANGTRVEVLIGIAVLNPHERAEDRQVAAFIADLTLQKKSEEVLRQTEKLAVAGRLAAAIAHEINNPLEAITLCLYLLEQEALAPDSRKYLDMAQKELNRVSKITMQTLRFYRSSTRPQNTDIRELIDTVLDLLDSKLRQQNITVTRDFQPIPDAFIQDGEIRQVLANLIGNSIDAMQPDAMQPHAIEPDGRLVLRTAAARDLATGEPGVRITVADNGSGIDPATISRIFEPFFSTKGLTGTGLGLWISREIVQKHNGQLRVRSSKGTTTHASGTIFTLFLPLGEAPALPLETETPLLT